MVVVRVRDTFKEIHVDANNFQSFDDFIERAFLVNKKQDPSSYDYLVNALQKGSIQNRGAGYTLKLSNSLVNDYINQNGKFAITLTNNQRAEPTVYVKLNESFTKWTKEKTKSGKDVNVGDTEFIVTNTASTIWKLFKNGKKIKETKYSFDELEQQQQAISAAPAPQSSTFAIFFTKGGEYLKKRDDVPSAQQQPQQQQQQPQQQ
jgi:hypothetical protein